jgi:hypothetical protein
MAAAGYQPRPAVTARRAGGADATITMAGVVFSLLVVSHADDASASPGRTHGVSE